jgi:hypothetical protein
MAAAEQKVLPSPLASADSLVRIGWRLKRAVVIDATPPPEVRGGAGRSFKTSQSPRVTHGDTSGGIWNCAVEQLLEHKDVYAN